MTTAAMPRTLQTGHVGLNVTDLDRSTAFYREVFGLTIQAESREDGRHFAFLTDGQRLVLTLWQQSAGAFAADQPGLHHLSFQVETLEEVRDYEERLRALGTRFLYESVVPHREDAASGGVFFTDPDGIRLEIYSPSGLAGHEAPVAGAPSCGFF